VSIAICSRLSAPSAPFDHEKCWFAKKTLGKTFSINIVEKERPVFLLAIQLANLAFCKLGGIRRQQGEGCANWKGATIKWLDNNGSKSPEAALSRADQNDFSSIRRRKSFNNVSHPPGTKPYRQHLKKLLLIPKSIPNPKQSNERTYIRSHSLSRWRTFL
jgi:hypothetical protein